MENTMLHIRRDVVDRDHHLGFHATPNKHCRRCQQLVEDIRDNYPRESAAGVLEIFAEWHRVRIAK